MTENHEASVIIMKEVVHTESQKRIINYEQQLDSIQS